MPPKKKNNTLKHKVEFHLYKMAEKALSCISVKSAFLLGELLGTLLFRFNKKYRAIVRKNLAVASSKHDLIHPSNDTVEDVFRKAGGNMVSAIAVSCSSSEKALKCLTVKNTAPLVKALQETGAMVVLAHMGNWELLTKFTSQALVDTPIGALYRPLNNPYMNQLVLERRESAGMTLISSRNPAFTIFRLLKKKGLFCVLSDQKIGARGIPTSFFGLTTNCTRLPLTIHEKNDTPIFSLSMTSVSAGKWEIEFTQIHSPTQQGIMDALSTAMSRSLTDCFWFQDRWLEFPSKELLQYDPNASSVYKGKERVGIVESLSLFHAAPELKSLLDEHHIKLLDWSTGASPEYAYFGIGSSVEFLEDCKQKGLRRTVLTVEQAKQRLL